MKKGMIYVIDGTFIIVFTVVTIMLWFKVREVSTWTGLTDAKVVDVLVDKETHVRRTGSGYRRKVTTKAYRPVIEFVTEDGTVVHEDYDVTTSYPRYKIGESTIVKYDVNNPKDWVIEGDDSYVFIAVVFSVVTIVLWGLSIYWIVLWRSN